MALLINHYKDLKGKYIALKEREIARDLAPHSWMMYQAAVNREHTPSILDKHLGQPTVILLKGIITPVPCNG